MSRTTLASGLLVLALAATTPAHAAVTTADASASPSAVGAADRAAAPTTALTGRVPTKAKRVVLLQRRTSTGWATIARTKTSKAGTYSFAVPRLARATTVRVHAPAVKRGKKKLPVWTSTGRAVPGTAVPTPAPAPSPAPAPAPTPAPTAAPTIGELRFRVTAFSQRDVVDMSQVDDRCGGISGTKTTTAHLRTPRAGDLTWPAQTDTLDGTTSVGISSATELTSTSVLHGCEFDDDLNKSACSRTQVERPVDGLSDTRVWIRIRKGSSQAEVIFDPGTPVVGNAGLEDTPCLVEETSASDHADEAKRTTTIPVAELARTGPITITNTGTQNWSSDHAGEPAQLDQRWSHSLTLERVDAAGNPLR